MILSGVSDLDLQKGKSQKDVEGGNLVGWVCYKIKNGQAVDVRFSLAGSNIFTSTGGSLGSDPLGPSSGVLSGMVDGASAAMNFQLKS
ncbi:hypothetical protein Tco_0717041 [Tanacetum coccineum]